MDAPTEPTRYGVMPPEIAITMSGLEALQAIIARRLPAPPIAQLMGFDLVEVEKGRAMFEGIPAFQHYNPLGSVHGGYAATLLDSCMACAVHSTLPKGVGYTTLEFKIGFIRALTVDTGRVRAEGKTISSGRRVATSEGRLIDARGRLLAHGTTTCLVFDLPGQP
jgi:uncharacterized protein (TIGR00369 family)